MDDRLLHFFWMCNRHDVKYSQSNPRDSMQQHHECNFTCLKPYSRSEPNCCSKDSSEQETLENVISSEGTGTYIVVACRGVASLPPDDAMLARQLSDVVY